MSYRVALTGAAIRDRRRLDPHLRRRIDGALRALAIEPRPPGAVKLTGRSKDWRIRIGDYRALFEIDDGAKRVLVWRIAHRREAYRWS